MSELSTDSTGVSRTGRPVPSPPATPESESYTTLRILLVDDNPSDVELLTLALRREPGYWFKVTVADRLETAIAHLAGNETDVVLLDLNLPDSRGLETVTRMREGAPDAPIVVMTGVHDDDLALAAAGAGAQEYLEKERLDPHLLVRTLHYTAERKRQEDAMRRGERRLRLMVENLPAGAAYIENGKIDFNTAAENIFGYANSEIRTLDEWFRTMFGKDHEQVRALYEKDRAEAFSTPRVVPLTHLGGNKRLVRFSGHLSDQAEIWLVDDVTDQENARIALEESEEKLRTLMANLDVGVYRNTGGPQGRFLEANPAMARIFGYDSLDEFTKIPVADLYLDPTERATLVKKARENERIDHMELRLKKKDGTPMWASCTARVHFDRVGDVEWMDGIIEDITERKQAEESLAQSEERLRAFIKALPDVSFIFDEDGRYVEVLTSEDQLLYREADEMKGRLLHDVLPREDADKFLELVRRTIKTRKSQVMSYELDVEAGTRWFEARTSPIREPSGEVELVVWVSRDATESKTAAQALEASEQKYRHLVDTLAEGIWAIDSEARTTFVNPRMAEMLGYTQEEMNGKHLFDFMDAEGIEECKGNLSRREEGVAEEHEFRFLHKTGHSVYVMMTTRPSYDEEGRYAGALAGVTDTTERRQIERALAASEMEYRQLYENIPLMYFTLSVDGTVLSVNEYGAEQLGYLREELIGQPVLDVFHPDDKESVQRSFQECVENPGHGATWEFRKVRKDGKVIWVEEAVRVVTQKGQDPIVLVACEDITDRKAVETALKKSEAQFRRLFEANLVGAFIGDTDGYIHEANDAALRLFGYTLEDLPLRWDRLTPKEWEKVDTDKLKELLETGVASPYEKEYLRKDGSRVPVWLGAALLEEPENHCIALVVDITDRKRAEAESQMLAASLLDVQEDERKRISELLHDNLGQLLTLAKLELESAADGTDLASRVAGPLRRLEEALGTLRNLAGSLRPPLLDDLGLGAALENLLEDFAESSGLQADLAHHGGTAYLSKPAATCLYRILQEALTNIAKHAKASEVKVGLDVGHDAVTLDIRDNGKGFDLANPPPGTGIGLLGMRERLIRLGGKLDVVSSVGKGTTITARLPMRRSGVRERET